MDRLLRNRNVSKVGHRDGMDRFSTHWDALHTLATPTLGFCDGYTGHSSPLRHDTA